MKIYPVGADIFMQNDGQTDRYTEESDMTKLVFSFRNFTKRLK